MRLCNDVKENFIIFLPPPALILDYFRFVRAFLWIAEDSLEFSIKKLKPPRRNFYGQLDLISRCNAGEWIGLDFYKLFSQLQLLLDVDVALLDL